MRAVKSNRFPKRKMRVTRLKVDLGMTIKPLLDKASVTQKVTDVSKAPHAHTPKEKRPSSAKAPSCSQTGGKLSHSGHMGTQVNTSRHPNGNRSMVYLGP